jgi:myo-inositol-1(or 4)-monophosphatase
MENPNLLLVLDSVIGTVERAGVLLAQEYKRPDGPGGSGDKAEIDVEIEVLVASLSAIQCLRDS